MIHAHGFSLRSRIGDRFWNETEFVEIIFGVVVVVVVVVLVVVVVSVVVDPQDVCLPFVFVGYSDSSGVVLVAFGSRRHRCQCSCCCCCDGTVVPRW